MGFLPGCVPAYVTFYRTSPQAIRKESPIFGNSLQRILNKGGGTTSIWRLSGEIVRNCRIRWRTTHDGSTRSHLFLLLFLPFTTPINAFNRGKQVISPRGSTDRVLWGETSADSLEECDPITELVRSLEFRILAVITVVSHPF